MEAHIGAIKSFSGAIEVQPGAMETHLRAVEAHIGAMKSFPEAIEIQPGAMEAHLGAIELIPEPRRLSLAPLWLY
jgi:hypothetical protein